MDITGAELIIRFLQNRAQTRRDAGAVAVIPGGAALRAMERALAASALKHGPANDASALFFDFNASLAQAAQAIGDAKTSRRAMICIAAQVPRSLFGGDECALDGRRALREQTKSWFHVGAAMELLELLPASFSIAANGRRGPVLLEIPEDVLMEVIHGAWIPQASTRAARRINRGSPLFA